MNKPELTMIELFSGTGMQRRGAENTDLFDLEITATSDVDRDAIVSYATVHCGLTNELIEQYSNYPTREKMVEELIERNIGMDFDKGKMFDWNKLIKKKTKDLEKYWLAMTLQNNLGDISKIKELPLADFWFYSFCCQDISLAGKQKGLMSTCEDCGHEFNPMDFTVEDRNTCPNCGSTNIKGSRSGLLKEVERLLITAIKNNTAPKYLCLENVKNLVGKKFKPDFDAWVERLEELGYNSYYQVLNAKECGRCQNRERIFCMSIRKDIDTKKYTFPLPFDTGVRLKDILEKNVSEKYYINTERASSLIQQLVDKGQLKGQNDERKSVLVKNQATEYTKTIDTANTLMARDWKGFGNQDMVAIVESETIDKSERIGGLFDGETRHQAGSVWNTNGLSPTIDTCQGGYREPCIVESFEETAETSQNKNTTKSTWKDINSHYKISSKGVVVDVINKCQVEEVDGKVELEVKGNMAKFPIDALLNKYFAEVVDTTKPICVGNTTPSGKSQCNAVYSTEGVSQTLCAGTHGYATGSILEEQEPEVIGIKQATKKGYIECELPGCADFSYPNSKLRRGRVQGGGQIVPALTAAEGGIRYIESIYRIRKLTPKECWLLMGMTFEDCQKCMDIGISNSALYKIAGNGIVTDCIKLLFEHLYKAQYDESYICTDEKMQNFQKPEVQ